jgi:hypothetical protein
MENLEKERIRVIEAFSADRFWAISGRAVLSGTICIKEIEMSKLKPPYESRSSNNDHIWRLAYVS